ncbi:MAG: cupredoxin domain-containing protein [Armatimonadetes bacterium]|nr:cupredoxin domain-containing protein [Armatimonadota bacterium]
MKPTLTILAAIALLAGASAQQSKTPSKGVQKATIVVDNGFKPDTINVKAGRPVQITFDTKHKACISSVVFAGMNLKKPLTDGKKTVVTFTPKKAGTYAFACPMKMMKGKVVAK